MTTNTILSGATPEKFFDVSLAYVLSLERSQKAGWSVVWRHVALGVAQPTDTVPALEIGQIVAECVHTAENSRGCTACAYTVFGSISVLVRKVQESYRHWRRYGALALHEGNFASSFRGVLLTPNLTNVLGNSFAISTSTPDRLISECKIWWEFAFNIWMYVSMY